MRILFILYRLFIFTFLAILVVIMGLYTNAYLSPGVDLKSTGNYELYDNKNNIISDSNNNWIKIDYISDNLLNAVVSIEDKNFYKHNGFDYLRIAKAMFKNFQNKKIVEGASTISQQYIKNAYLTFDKTWARKIKEALMTLNLETHYTKEEILEAYLNTINYGQGNYGVNNAAKYYFNKKVNELTLEEALILAGIPKNPSNYNPVSNYENAVKRAKIVALTMLNNNYINKTTYDNLFKNNINIIGKKNDDDLKMILYYEDAVINELKELNIYPKEDITSSGLKIYTTLDYNMQKNMEKEIINNLDDKNLQVASVIVAPEDGSVLALTGGIDYNISQYNRAINSKRQVGSTMKPFLYYAALKNGMTSSSTFTSQYTTFNLENGKTYAPKNWANIYGNKDITMAAAIAYSDNIYAVKTNLFLGVDELINTSHLAGINANLQNVPSLALGTSEINLIDFATGYTTLASGGYKKKLHLINKVEDKDGELIYEFKKQNDLVLNPNYVFILNELLTSTTNASFIDYNSPTALGISNKLSRKYALKTGTTDADYWTVGYNKNVLMVMWTGYDDNSDISISVGSKSKNIWANIIEKYDYNNKDSWYQMPSNIIGLPLNAVNGKYTSEATKINVFYYLKGSEPLITN